VTLAKDRVCFDIKPETLQTNQPWSYHHVVASHMMHHNQPLVLVLVLVLVLARMIEEFVT
jgi:hypothetical protein